MADPTPFDGKSWKWEAPKLDVIAYANIGVEQTANARGYYMGRTHSLYYCDAASVGNYGWYETAFMHNPLIMPGSEVNVPFSLVPGEEAAKALWHGVAEYQLAWPFEHVDAGDCDEFIDRWIRWFLLEPFGVHQPIPAPCQKSPGVEFGLGSDSGSARAVPLLCIHLTSAP